MPVKPSEQEEEYFARLEFERRKKDAEERGRKLAEEERRRLKDVHFMRCPKCGMELVEVGYRDIKVDRCTGCSGVWLDNGEMERVAGKEGFVKAFVGIFSK